MSDDTSDTNTTKSTRSNTKVYPHVLPRVDPEYYQAEIPNAYSGPAPTEAVKVSWFESTREVHSTNKSEEAKRQFLTFARNVFDRAHHSNLVWGKDLSTFPLHSDEHALEFLALHNYEINRAKFFLCSFLGGGREAIHMTRVRQQLAKLPTGVHVNEKLELMFKELNTSIIFGVLSSSPSSERTYVMETTGPHRLQQIDSESNARSKSSRSSRKGGCSSGTEHHSPLGNKDRYRGKADKQEMKKKWLGILRTSNTLISGIKSEYGGYSRPSLESLQDLFRLIFTALPIPSDILLGEEHYATLQTNLHELIDKYIHCKEWAADVYDAFCPNSSCATDFKHLKKMLNEGERLPFRCVVEENQLKRTIKDLENLATEGRRILDICSNKKILTESEKVSLFDLNELLKVTSPFKAIDNIPNMPQASINSLRNLYRRSIELNETIENALHRAALPRSKRSRVNKLNLTEAVELHNETSSFPVVLYGVPHLKAGMVWNTEMRQVCADGAPLVSLNKLEALISSGEKLPVDFTEELDALRDKRSQAKQWLEKFRKSVAVTSRASRHGDGGSGPQGSGGKMGLSDMKKMVEQGEQLYEERKNKDLTRAVDLVDAAEEWIARVMESMEAGENVDIDELQDLLDETEGMPVAMEEAGLLRCHIEALKWAAKAKPALEKKSSKLSTLQKLQREITRIRESLSEDMRKRMTNRLPEETKLAEILCDVQNWQQQMKRKFQDGKVSASLEVLKDLLAKAEELPLDLDTETKSLRLAVTEATDWIHSHMDTLVSLGIPIASVDINLPRDICASFTEGEDMEIPTDESFNPNILGTPTRDMVHDTPVGSPHLNSSPNLVGYPDIKLLIESAKHISITFPELTSARERFDDVISWLDMVELKCPKRSGKKPQHTADFDFRHGEFSCVQTSELEELLEEANKLRVVFPDEIQRINDVISRAYEWEKNTQDKLTSVFEGMHDMMLKSRGYVVSPKYSEFPFMKGAEVDSNEIFDFFEISTEQKGTMLKVESRKYDSTTTTTTTPPWEDLEQTFVPALNALIREGEEAGAMTSKSMVLAVCMNVLQWVSIVKGKLMNLNWGDCTR